jgi:transposase-like protein
MDSEATLIEIMHKYATPKAAIETLEAIRWPNGPICPHCGCTGNVASLNGKACRPGLKKCRDCRKQFTVTVGTIFEDSHIPLNKWFIAIYLMCASKKSMSSHQIHRMLKVTYKSAWFMTHRIRYAMHQEPMVSMLKGKGGIVEADETFVGGKSRRPRGNGRKLRWKKKTPVVALIERGGSARIRPVESVSGKNLRAAISGNVDPSAKLVTDDWKAYRSIGRAFEGGHEFVRHIYGEYARGDVHVNTAESFFALLKRGIMGTYHHVSKQHLKRYCSEYEYRWNLRKQTDADRLLLALKMAEGKRLTYRGPISLLGNAAGEA